MLLNPTKDAVLKNAGYKYDFERMAYFNDAHKRAFTVGYVEWVTPRQLLRRAVPARVWRIHSKTPISSGVRDTIIALREGRRPCSHAPLPPNAWCFTHCYGWNGETPELRTIAQKRRMYNRVRHWPECLNHHRDEYGKPKYLSANRERGCAPFPPERIAAIREAEIAERRNRITDYWTSKTE